LSSRLSWTFELLVPAGRHYSWNGAPREVDMNSKRIQEQLIEAARAAPITKTLGITLEYDGEGNAVFRMPRNRNFDHGMQDTHGGIFATLLDNAGWFTVAAQCAKTVVTSDLHVRMLQPAKQQDLVATGKLVRAGSKSAVAEMKLHSASGELIAVGTASFSFVSEIPQ
jgi:uncharacterized protein (TIGR00369 family)